MSAPAGTSSLQHVDWSKLPVPEDDGAAAHLSGARIADVALPSSAGGAVSLARLPGRTVLFIYPMTGTPGVALPDGWDAIPGARGCTPHACAFRDLHADLKAAGAAAVFGLSTQTLAEQQATVERLHLPFPLLSDAALALARAMALPTMEVDGKVMIRRLALVLDDGVITKVFYPVFPPDRNAADVLAWLAANPRSQSNTGRKSP
jgi:peroxiredoxin